MKKTVRWTSNFLLDLSAFFLLIMMFHVSLDVFLKYAINQPVHATLEIVSYYYMVFVVFLPIAFVESARQSIVVDIFYNIMPYNLKVICIGLAFLVCVLVYGGLAWLTFGDAMRSFGRNEIVFGNTYMPIWPSRFVLPVSFFMGALVCLWHLWSLIISKERRQEIMMPQQPTEDI